MQHSRYVPRGEALGTGIEVLVTCNEAGRSKQAAARLHLNDLPTARAPPGRTQSQRHKVEPMVAPHRLDYEQGPSWKLSERTRRHANQSIYLRRRES